MLRFNGSNQNINLGEPSHLKLTGAMTVMAWVVSEIKQDVEIWTKYKVSDRCWSLQTDEDGVDTYGFFWLSSDGTSGKGSGWSGKLTHGELFHIAGVYRPSVAIEIYQNGSLSNSKTSDIPASQNDNVEDVIIASRNGGQYFQGQIGDVRIYNRDLSAEEISTIYHSRGADVIKEGLLGRWMLDEGSPESTASGSGVIKDLSHYKNNGTPANSPIYKTSLAREKRRIL